MSSRAASSSCRCRLVPRRLQRLRQLKASTRELLRRNDRAWTGLIKDCLAHRAQDHAAARIRVRRCNPFEQTDLADLRLRWTVADVIADACRRIFCKPAARLATEICVAIDRARDETHDVVIRRICHCAAAHRNTQQRERFDSYAHSTLIRFVRSCFSCSLNPIR